MTTAAEYRARAEKALLPGDGMLRPNASQLTEADVHVGLAKVVELGRIADALEALAANTTPAPVIHPAIHHGT